MHFKQSHGAVDFTSPRRSVKKSAEKAPPADSSCCLILSLVQFPLRCLHPSSGETQRCPCALGSCFPQIIHGSPLGHSRDSRLTRCACLIKESDAYKCKHSIIFSQCCCTLPLIWSLLAGGFPLSRKASLVNSIGEKMFKA